MAPNTAVAVDPQVVHAVAASLRLPRRAPKEIAEELLARLSGVKRRRELRGLNHWEEYAPDYLQRLAERHERLRARAIEAFFRAEKSKALACAQVWLGDRGEAVDAVGEAFLKLLAGKAGPEHFYRILRLVCVDCRRARSSAAKVFGRRYDVPVQGEEAAAPEPACSEVGGGDPLELLIRAENIQEGIRKVKTESGLRDVRRLGWWDELMSHYEPRGAEGKRPAQTNM